MPREERRAAASGRAAVIAQGVAAVEDARRAGGALNDMAVALLAAAAVVYEAYSPTSAAAGRIYDALAAHAACHDSTDCYHFCYVGTGSRGSHHGDRAGPGGCDSGTGGF